MLARAARRRSRRSSRPRARGARCRQSRHDAAPGPSRCTRSAPARRLGRWPGTSRSAAGCARACGTARRRRSRWRAASRRARRRRPRRRSRSCRRPASAWPGRRRTASRAGGARPSRRGGRLDAVVRATIAVEAAPVEHPVELVGEQQQRRDRRRVVGLVLARVLERGAQRQEVGDPARRRRRRPVAAISLDPLQRGRAEQRQPQPAVGGEALLGREVVDVGVGSTSTGSPPAPEVASISTSASSAPAGRVDRDHHAGRGLVVRPGDHVASDASDTGSGASPGSASTTIGSARNGALARCRRRTWRRTRRR